MSPATRRFYNPNVRDMNTCIQVFPSSIIAALFRFNTEEYFEVEVAGAHLPPQVQVWRSGFRDRETGRGHVFIIDANTVFGGYRRRAADVSLDRLLAVMAQYGIARTVTCSTTGIHYDAENGN